MPTLSRSMELTNSPSTSFFVMSFKVWRLQLPVKFSVQAHSGRWCDPNDSSKRLLPFHLGVRTLPTLSGPDDLAKMVKVQVQDGDLKRPRPRPSHLSLVFSQTYLTPDVINYSYPGSGTIDSPYFVDWIPDDPRNPYNLPTGTKWAITMIMAFGALAVSLSSTAFAGTIPQVQLEFGVSPQLAVASVSLLSSGSPLGL